MRWKFRSERLKCRSTAVKSSSSHHSWTHLQHMLLCSIFLHKILIIPIYFQSFGMSKMFPDGTILVLSWFSEQYECSVRCSVASTKQNVTVFSTNSNFSFQSAWREMLSRCTEMLWMGTKKLFCWVLRNHESKRTKWVSIQAFNRALNRINIFLFQFHNTTSFVVI